MGTIAKSVTSIYMTKNKKAKFVWHWPFLRINSNGAKEYACYHGIGHGGVHGCDGCCRDKNYPKEKK